MSCSGPSCTFSCSCSSPICFKGVEPSEWDPDFDEGKMGPAEASGMVQIGDVVVAVQKEPCLVIIIII